MTTNELLASISDLLRNIFGDINSTLSWVGDSVGSLYYDISEEIWKAIDWIGRTIADSYSRVKSVVTDGFHYVTDYTYAVINDVSTAIGRMTDYLADKIGGAISTVKNGITDLAVSIWGSIKAAGAYIYEGLGNVVGGIGAGISTAVSEVKSFLSSQWTLISGFWGGVIGDIKSWLGEKLDALWGYFVDVVVPALMDGFNAILMSDAVSWILDGLEKHIFSAFDKLLDFDKDDMEAWLKDTFASMKKIALEVSE